jgi:hypothetical protein
VCRAPLFRDAFYDSPATNSPVPQPPPKPGLGGVRPPLPLPRGKPPAAFNPVSHSHGPTSHCNHGSCPDPEKHANVIEELGWMMGKPPPSPRRMDSPDHHVTAQPDGVTAQTDDVIQQMSATSLQEQTNVRDVLKVRCQSYSLSSNIRHSLYYNKIIVPENNFYSFCK